jgi:Domain of unknown function (DUF4265)
MSEQREHVGLMVEGAPPGKTQPVEVEAISADHYRVLHSPGFVEGIAAGDTIRITDRELGLFEVASRGGNVAVKFAAEQPIAGVLQFISTEFELLGGRFDGAIGRAGVWTVPVAAGFNEIEGVMARAVALMPGSQWWYGNVYANDGEPLRWWEHSSGAESRLTRR